MRQEIPTDQGEDPVPTRLVEQQTPVEVPAVQGQEPVDPLLLGRGQSRAGQRQQQPCLRRQISQAAMNQGVVGRGVAHCSPPFVSGSVRTPVARPDVAPMSS